MSKSQTLSKSMLTQYLENISRHPLMTPSEEIQCGRAVQQMLALEEAAKERELTRPERHAIKRGERAKKRFIEANLRLVVHCAKKYMRNSLTFTELGDLIQEGSIGLMRAVELYDPERGYKFSTYAYWWIRQAMTRSISISEWTIRRPSTVGELAVRLPSLVQQLSHQLGRLPSSQELAKAAKISLKELLLIYERGRGVVSLDSQMPGMEDGALLDIIADPTSLSNEDLDSEMDLSMNQAVFDLVMDMLTDIEMRLLELRFGLNGGEPQTLNAIGKEFGISRERVRQLLDRCIRKIRFQLNTSGLFGSHKDAVPAAVAMEREPVPSSTLRAGRLVAEDLPLAVRKAQWLAQAPQSGALLSARCSGSAVAAA